MISHRLQINRCERVRLAERKALYSFLKIRLQFANNHKYSAKPNSVVLKREISAVLKQLLTFTVQLFVTQVGKKWMLSVGASSGEFLTVTIIGCERVKRVEMLIRTKAERKTLYP